MEIEEKYLGLLNLLIYDKRTGEYGMISELCISQMFNGYNVYYTSFNNRFNESYVFIEDFEKGNVVFLIPFATDYRKEDFEKLASKHKTFIKHFFGEQYRDDMIMEINEEDRQKQIRYWESLSIGIDNWEHKLKNDKEEK